MLQNEEHQVIMKTAANHYMYGVAQVELSVAGSLSKHYLEEPVKQAVERGEKAWAGQIVFSWNQLIAVRLNEQVRGSVRVGNRQYQVSRTMFASVQADKVDFFIPEEHETHLTHVFELYGNRGGKLDRPSNIWIHNLSEILRNFRCSAGAGPKILRMQVCPVCEISFEPNPHVPHKKYCSEKCRQSAKKKRKNKKNEAGRSQ